MQRFVNVSLIIISVLSLLFLLSDTFSGALIQQIENIKGDPPIPAVNEVVMPPISNIQATTDTGTINIRSGEGLRRFYTWDGITKTLLMVPNPERWFGDYGISYPGPGYHWFPGHKGISRAVAGEGQQHFNNKKEALDWITKQKEWCPIVYRDDGLLVCYKHVLPRKQMNIDVTQIYINGEKPTSLEGSNNELIKTSWD